MVLKNVDAYRDDQAGISANVLRAGAVWDR